MPESPPTSDGAPHSHSVWERLYALFQRRVVDDGYAERPRRRGAVITVSIVVSSLLWFTFTMRETHMEVVRMPTDVVNVPEDQSLSQLPPDDVRVQVVGDGWSLLRLWLRPPTVHINASLNEVSLQDVLPDLPKNVEVQSVSPGTLNLWKETRITRKVPVELRTEFETPGTHAVIGDPEIRPDSVEVSGAASVVGDLRAWPTVERAFENVRDTLVMRVPLSDTLSGLVARNVEDVRVQVVSQQLTEASREIKVTVQGQPSTRQLVSLEPSTIVVHYNVITSQFREAENAMDFYATVSYDEIRADTTGRVSPVVHPPDNLVIRDIRKTPERLAYYERID